MQKPTRSTLLLVLAVLTSAPAAAFAQSPQKACNDAIPPDCKTVKYLGEDKGCACFACNPDTKQRKVICTKNEEDRAKLMKLKDAAPTPAAGGSAKAEK
jgi:hypothetical protein